MYKLYFTLILILIVSCNNNEEDTLKKTLDNCDRITEYKLEIATKPFFKNDTVIKNYQVSLMKNSSDSIYGYDFKLATLNHEIFNTNNTLYHFLTKKGIYIIENKKNNTINKHILPNNLFSLEDILDTLHTKVHIKNDTIIVNKRLDSSKGFNNINIQYHISRKNNLPYSMSTNVNFQSTNQYEKLVFKEFKFSPIVNDLSKEVNEKIKLSKLHITKKKDTLKKRIKKSVNFKGEYFAENTKVNMSDFQDNIIILDYWYKSCYPCIKAIPLMNRIHEKYKTKNVSVFGINIIDDKQKQQSILKRFIKDNKIAYPNIFTKENPYQIDGFPTLLIINKKQEIVYIKEGYNTGIEEEIFNVIEKELTQNINN